MGSLIFELRIPPDDAYYKVANVLSEINDSLAKCDPDGQSVSPQRGVFSYASPEFGLESFTKLYSDCHGVIKGRVVQTSPHSSESSSPNSSPRRQDDPMIINNSGERSTISSHSSTNRGVKRRLPPGSDSPDSQDTMVDAQEHKSSPKQHHHSSSPTLHPYSSSPNTSQHSFSIYPPPSISQQSLLHAQSQAQNHFFFGSPMGPESSLNFPKLPTFPTAPHSMLSDPNASPSFRSTASLGAPRSASFRSTTSLGSLQNNPTNVKEGRGEVDDEVGVILPPGASVDGSLFGFDGVVNPSSGSLMPNAIKEENTLHTFPFGNMPQFSTSQSMNALNDAGGPSGGPGSRGANEFDFGFRPELSVNQMLFRDLQTWRVFS